MRSNGLYDFMTVIESRDKNNRKVFTPAFEINSKTKDLMIRGKKFYAIYNYKTNMWETDITVAMELIDEVTATYVRNKVGDALMNDPDYSPIVKRIVDTINGLSKKFRNFVEVDMEDRWNSLNQKVKWCNSEIKREDYISYVLPYPLVEGPITYFKKLMDRLYLPDEAKKICWMIGALLCGDQGKIQKFFVFFGDPGTGKSTIIDKVIVETLLGGYDSPYTSKFTADALISGQDSFGTDFLSTDPIFAYDDDADLSRVNSKTTLNMIVSHERVRVNAKYSRIVWMNPKCFLVCGTNDPVQLSQRSGFIRRLIDIRPTGELLSTDEYDECINQLQFEKSGIAWYCMEVYRKLGKNHYNHYIPEDMLYRTDPFHNFVKDYYSELCDGITLSNSYDLYELYCNKSNLKSVMPKYKFRDNLRLYFEEYGDHTDANGKVIERFFSGFKKEKIGIKDEEAKPVQAPTAEVPKTGWLHFDCTESLFDISFSNRPAQYAKDDGTPKLAWNNVTSVLADIDTSALHWVKVPDDVIVIDLDIKDENGNKSYSKNLEAANKFPPTYAELSKSGSGIHLHYIWTGGDPDEVSRLYGENIEVKVFKGNSALRRQLTKCNDFPIAELSSGLPLKGAKKTVIDWDGFKNERILRAMIIKNLNKEYHQFTKPSIDYINDLLKKAYESGATYDVRDMQQKIFDFALQSHNKADYCIDKVTYMHFCSKDIEDAEKNAKELVNKEDKDRPIIFLDIESFGAGKDPVKEPALLVICWKYAGEDQPVIKMINPKPDEVASLFRLYNVIGFNNRDYDNHICYARMCGYTIDECNKLSRKMIESDDPGVKRSCKFKEAYGISYTDVYDFAASHNKMSLKKWEIKLGIHHQENSIPWDKPAPMNRWDEIADYCANDVRATEAVFNYIHSDFVAREILADLSGLTVNDTTNQHTTAILTAGIEDPQSNYIYTKLGEMRWEDGSLVFPGYEYDPRGIDRSRYTPGVKVVSGKSIYRGVDPGEGGRKIGYPGMYSNVALLDVASMHPHSAIKLNIFGDEITRRYEALVEGRVAIKHGDYDKAVEILKVLGKDLSKYFTGTDEEIAANTAGLADAIKTAANSVYGLTSASFNNKLRDPRNIDNIVAKYGALFMVNLENDLKNLGCKVVHISTDSCKVADATPEIINYIQEYGKRYGYTFEFEAFIEKMTLVNEAVYIAKFADEETCLNRFNYIPSDNKKAVKKGKMWDATGKQFAVPYVYKTLFSHEPIIFEDMCETFNVKEGAIYLDYNETLPDVSMLEEALKKYLKSVRDMSECRNTLSTATDPDEIEKYNKKFATAERAYNKTLLYFRETLGASNEIDKDLLVDMVYEAIAKGHDYHFVGRVGQFTPVRQGCGSAEMVCIRDDRENTTSPSGSKGYRWLESDTVKASKQNYIDKEYYRSLVDKASDSIAEYGDLEWFLS